MAGLSLSLGLGLGPMRRTASAAFSPAALFSASEPGFWAEVSTATLWQDVARTTPVTAAGQAVASWQLNTALGPVYATQATAGSMPQYQLDGARGYLLFDGTDDFLTTPTITPGIDKAQMFAGVRKLSDAAAAIIAETSTNSSSLTGSLAMFGPAGAGTAEYASRSRGSVASTATTPASFAAPITNVLTGLFDIATDGNILRVNGTQAATSVTDQGTGNYLAYPLYIGRRAGTSAPFNGRMYGLALRFGAALSAEQVAQMETWMNGKTGAY